MKAVFTTTWWADVDSAEEAARIAQAIDSAFVADVARALDDLGLTASDVAGLIGRTQTAVALL